jgi:hypothetical protein
MQSGYCVPTSTEVREDGAYHMSSRVSDAECNRHGACRKSTHKFAQVMPGLFAIFCPHGICLAFFFMSKFESPETLFSFILQRRKKPPYAIVYDSCCREQHYAMNREPFYFKDVEFFIDCMHNTEHVQCSSGYTVRRYPHYNGLLTEVAEQMFSLLAKIKINLINKEEKINREISGILSQIIIINIS